MKLEDEARAEEEFVADKEDEIENPLVEKKGGSSSKAEDIETDWSNWRKEESEPKEKAFEREEESGHEEEPESEEEVEEAEEDEDGGQNLTAQEDSSDFESSASSVAREMKREEGKMDAASNDDVKNENVFTTNKGTQSKKPKAKIARIIVAIILVLALIGAGVGAAIYLNWRQSPEIVTKDAFLAMLRERKDGSYKIRLNADLKSQDKSSAFDGFGGTSKTAPAVTKMSLNFDINTKGDNAMTDGKIELELGEGKKLDLDVAAAYFEGKEIYFKLGNLGNVLSKDLIKSFFGGENSGDDGALLGQIMVNVSKNLEDKWYKISVDDIKDEKVKQTLSCTGDSVKELNASKVRKQIAELYEKNTYLTVKDNKLDKEEGGLNYYKLEVNKEKAKAFSKAVEELDSVKKFTKCIEDGKSEEDEEALDEKIETESEDLYKDTELSLAVEPWTHRARKFIIKKNNDAKTETVVEFKDEVKAVEKPHEAKNIEQLKSDFLGATKTAYLDWVKVAAKTNCASQGAKAAECEKMVIDQFSKQLNELPEDQIFNQFMPGLTDSL